MGSALRQLARGLAATVALVALVAGVPAGLALAVGWPLPAGIPTIEEINQAARGGIDDMVILKALALLGWVAWSQIVFALVVEAVALVRGRPAGRAPVLPGLQPAVAHLLAAAVLATGLLGSHRAGPAPLGTLAAATHPVTVLTEPVPTEPVHPPAPAPAEPVAQAPVEQARTYTVQRNDSWWEIAEAHLGDGLRWREIRSFNLGRTMPDGRSIGPQTETIHPGWVLRIPPAWPAGPAGEHPSAVDPAGTEVVVSPGDNLWSLAEAHLEQLHQRAMSPGEVRPYWQEVIAANRERLADPADPDLIFTGQEMRLPPLDTQHAPAPPVLAEEPAQPTGPPETADHDPGPPRQGHRPPEPDALPAPPEAIPAAPAPAATPQPVAPPATSAPDGEEIEEEDLGDAAPAAGLLGTAGALLAVGLSATLWRRRRRRDQHLGRGAHAPAPPADLDELRAEIVCSADVDHVEELRAALVECAGELARRRCPARVRVVQAGAERIELLLSEPVLPAPGGWRPEASGTAWVRHLPGERPHEPQQSTHPALVSLGRRERAGQLYLDLESEGLISITGDAAGALARSIALEFATSPLAEGVSVEVVGELDLGENLDRLRQARCWDQVADHALSWAHQTRALLAANRWPSPQAARALTDRPDDLAPLVILTTQEIHDERFAALCSTIAEALLPVVVVAVGHELEGALAIRTDGDQLHVPSLGISCAAQAVSADAAAAVDRLLACADEAPAQMSPIPETATGDGEAEPAPCCEGPYSDPPYDVLVKVLGEIEVVGGRQPLSPKQAAVVTFIALHNPTTAERVEDAVWSAPTASRRKRLANTISDARPALGADHLPAAHDGRYRVGPRVRTDLELFERRLAYARTQDPHSAIETLRGALELVSGPVFTYRNADRSSYAWVDTENWISTTELKVTDTAEDLAERYLEQGDTDGAIWAARRGLAASPTHTRLTHLLMRAHFAAGDANAAERVYESHVSALEELQLDEVDPQLVETYQQIRRGSAAAG
jgi:DNA-binding SARP family transcriptional activator/nucleoid-associated protein YgaU